MLIDKGIYVSCGLFTYSYEMKPFTDLPHVEVFNLVKKLQTDIYADTMYPNDLRPGTNHGYNTEYKND